MRIHLISQHFKQRIKTTLLIVIIIIEYYSTQVVHYKRENSRKCRLSFKKRFQDLVETYLKTVSVNPEQGTTVDNAFEFIKLDTSVNTLPTDTSTLVGLEFTGSTSSIKARVIRVETGVVLTRKLYMFNIQIQTLVVLQVQPSKNDWGENITSGGTTLTVQTTNTIANPTTGQGTIVHVSGGDFFVRGRFVFKKILY